MKTKAPLILASQSPRRLALLQELGLEFTTLVRPVEEVVREDFHPRAVAVMISEDKAKAYDDLDKTNIILTADTVVAIGNEIFGKPASEEEAIAMLKRFSGITHTVVTGVTIFHKGRFKSFSEETAVTFRPLRQADILHYVQQYRPYDKAGGYAIQEWIGMVGVSRIEGDYYNVMGLPVGRLLVELQEYM